MHPTSTGYRGGNLSASSDNTNDLRWTADRQVSVFSFPDKFDAISRIQEEWKALFIITQTHNANHGHRLGMHAITSASRETATTGDSLEFEIFVVVRIRTTFLVQAEWTVVRFIGEAVQKASFEKIVVILRLQPTSVTAFHEANFHTAFKAEIS